jgi:beta-lactamase class D OXA-1
MSYTSWTWLLILVAPNALAADPTALFSGGQGCLVVHEVATGEVVHQVGSLCAERLYACSTFKLPLAAIAFDAGLITPDTRFTWDKQPKPLPSWNGDQTVRSWLAESVVWVSQTLTPRLGLDRLKAALADLHYGNEDLSGGLTTAWLSGSLRISPLEQVDMLRRMRRHDVRLSREAVTQAVAALPVAADEPDFRVIGKTGSGFSWKDPAAAAASPFRVGWYVGWLTRGGRDYAFALVLKRPSKPEDWVFTGAEAKALALTGLREALPSGAPAAASQPVPAPR